MEDRYISHLCVLRVSVMSYFAPASGPAQLVEARPRMVEGQSVQLVYDASAIAANGLGRTVEAVIAQVVKNSTALLFRGELLSATNPVMVPTSWLASETIWEHLCATP